MTQKKRKIPKNAVKALVQHSKELSAQTGKSAEEILEELLQLMEKYSDYFFSEPWQEKPDSQFGLGEKAEDFIEQGETLEERCERFTTACLRRNISLEGFDSERFTENFESYGGDECYDCSVPEAMHLRSVVEQLEKRRKDVEEEMKMKEPSWNAVRMSEHFKKPSVIKADKMRLVKLRIYEGLGCAKGKSCDVKNKYKCPYGEEAKLLIKRGWIAGILWEEIMWYDRHWNFDGTFCLIDPKVKKWYHYDEPGIIDVTSLEDIRKAISDGRLTKIMKEHDSYAKETGTQY